MIVVVHNQSTRRAFRRTKRIITAVLPAVGIRLNLGDVPKRVMLALTGKLRDATTKGTCVKMFVADSSAYRGFKCIEFGTKAPVLAEFTYSRSKFDIDLIAKGLISRDHLLDPAYLASKKAPQAAPLYPAEHCLAEKSIQGVSAEK